MNSTHRNPQGEAGPFAGDGDALPEGEPRTPQAHLVANTAADDAAYESLVDLSALLAGRAETVIIGGHMVSLLCAAFPSPGLVERRTGDADAGIPVELAATGELHEELLELGYTAEAGNRYIKGDNDPQPTIDLLVPSYTGRFGDEKKGSRAFDTMPGLGLAMNPRIELDVHITFRDDLERSTVVMVPGIEAAIVLKAIAWKDRRFETDKDAIDLSNLFAVLAEHGSDRLGGWYLDDPELGGTRRDAAASLHRLAAEGLTADRVLALAETGDADASRVVRDTGAFLARVVAVLGSTYDPERVIVCGAIAESIQPVLDAARDVLRPLLDLPAPAILRSKLGADIVLAGAVSTALAAARTVGLPQLVARRLQG